MIENVVYFLKCYNCYINEIIMKKKKRNKIEWCKLNWSNEYYKVGYVLKKKRLIYFFVNKFFCVKLVL